MAEYDDEKWYDWDDDYEDEEDDFYDEDCFPSYMRSEEFTPIIELVKKCVRAEYRNKVERLEDENKKLSEFRDSYDTYQSALKELEEKTEKNMKTLTQKSFRQFIKDFFEDRYILVTDFVYDVFDKCNRCNDHRMIEFKSPTGKSMTETCPCHQGILQYKPSKISSYELLDSAGTVRIFTLTDKDHYRVELTDFTYYAGESYEFLMSEERRLGTSYNGQLTPRFTHTMFKTLDECQAFCDYINNIKYNDACVSYCKALCNADGIEYTDQVLKDFKRGDYR